ncbi:MAG: hypothetical protein ACK5QX_10360, partial [bacterium]
EAHCASSQPGLTVLASAGSLARTLGLACQHQASRSSRLAGASRLCHLSHRFGSTLHSSHRAPSRALGRGLEAVNRALRQLHATVPARRRSAAGELVCPPAGGSHRAPRAQDQVLAVRSSCVGRTVRCAQRAGLTPRSSRPATAGSVSLG